MPKTPHTPKEEIKPDSTKRERRRKRRKEASARRKEIRRQKRTRWTDKLIGNNSENSEE